MVRFENECMIGQKTDYFGPYVQPEISYDNTPSIELANGVQMPLLGLGTTHSGGYYHDSVVYAIRDCKYRMIDTAKRYGVERELGIAIKMSGVQREQLFLNSKLWPVDFGSSVYDACLKSCKRLGTEYLDLYMSHFPEVPTWFVDAKETREETWRQMELLYDDGIIRSIGVSNYTKKDLEDILEFCSVRPHVNQFEYHPCYNPEELINFCHDEDIVFMGYCPLAKGKILDEEVIKAVAEKHYKTPAQVCIRYSIQNGVPAIPKSRQQSRILENSQVFDFHLDEEDMHSLRKLNSMQRKIINTDGIQEKLFLPDGYKLQGQVFGVPQVS
ncbi:hypothetical protein QR680_000977 [Steinernema hermaphroditum]|uniref:NADP-dependent oxidoreductase domain-containing protein n=1 Tax=Steinernema hermaphroditum TaxID=289476 RepID=A0AA39GWN6_9BILA|nr:hypothetical protein QR680_000977 [Steinernema hermaphroditum]